MDKQTNKTKTFWKPFFKWMFRLMIVAGVILLVLIWLERIEQHETRQDQPPPSVKPLVVESEAVSSGPVTEWIVGEGRAEAVRKQHLQFEAAGKIFFIAKGDDALTIREGSRVQGPAKAGSAIEKSAVSKGQLLAALDRRDQTSDIRQAKAALVEARHIVKMEQAALVQSENELSEATSDFKRKKGLFGKQVLARSTFEQAGTRYRNAIEELTLAKARLAVAESKVSSMQTELKKAERNHEKAAVYAPFNGIVARINIKEGDYFDPGSVNHTDESEQLETAPITIIDPAEMEITLNLPEFEGPRIQVGRQVVIVPGGADWFRGNAISNDPGIKGTVHAVSPLIDVARRAIRVKIRMMQPEKYHIIDGMYVTCWIAAKVKNKVCRVPVKSLLFEDDDPYVYAYKDGSVKKQRLQLGIIDSSYAEVLNGVSVNDLVITKGRNQLSDRQPVRLVGAKNMAKLP